MAGGLILLKTGRKVIQLGGDFLDVSNDAHQLRSASRHFELTGTGTAGVAYREFTEENLRLNMKILTGKNPGPEIHAHHVFPRNFSDDFERLGINVNDPRFGAWVEAGWHNKVVHQGGQMGGAYNREWRRFLDGNPTTVDAFRKARELGERYGLTLNF